MNTNQMFAIMDFIMVGAGLYLLFAWYLLQFKNEIREGVLVQTGMAKKCKDLEGYKRYIGPKLLIFALCAIASGAIGLYSDYVKPVYLRTVYQESAGDVFLIFRHGRNSGNP